MGIGLLLVYFVYGLAFWVMGLAVLLESGRVGASGDARPLHLLASFGILHGTHEWLEAYLTQAGALGTSLPSWLDWFRLGLLTASFLFLLSYALTSMSRLPSGSRRAYWPYGLPLFVLLLSLLALGGLRADDSFDLIRYLDTAARYAVAVPAAILAALTVVRAARLNRVRDSDPVWIHLRMAATGFAAYGLAQLIVHRQAWFPASVLNQEAFLQLTLIPVQALRGVFATLISFGLLRAMQATERLRQAELVAAHKARLAAVEEQDTLRRDLLRHVVRSQEAERARIARELHDDIAQFLSAFSLQLGSLRTHLRGAGTTAIVDQLQDLSQQMSQSIHRLVRNLRPSHLDSLGLVPALKFLLNQEFGPRGLDVTFNATGRLRPLPGPVDTALFRIAQEALTNIVRHAGVACADMELRYEPRHVTLRVSDNGEGFDPAEHFMPPRGWGLAGMRERVAALSGSLRVQSTPRHGTTVEVVIPVPLAQLKDEEIEKDQASVG